ncbi:MAG: YtxH domain-containing protein [Candidatus Gracilibacteria bacterium]|jgi:gas vesicle protein
MSEENGKKKSSMDDIIMGAILGTAIGSAIGMGLAPKKGSETREVAKETGTGLLKLGKKLLKKAIHKLKSSPKAAVDMKEIPNEMEILPPSGPTSKSLDHD